MGNNLFMFRLFKPHYQNLSVIIIHYLCLGEIIFSYQVVDNNISSIFIACNIMLCLKLKSISFLVLGRFS